MIVSDDNNTYVMPHWRRAELHKVLAVRTQITLFEYTDMILFSTQSIQLSFR